MYNYLYLIQDKNDINTNIYKIGKTTQLPDKRFKGYSEGTYPLCIFKVDDCGQRENELKNIFREKYKLERGYEYFRGNINSMIQDFVNLCGQINQIPLNQELNDQLNNTTINLSNNITTDVICDICNVKFKSEKILAQHQKKKNKCDITTSFQCIDCNKYFKYKKNLTDHVIKQICKENNKIINNSKPILSYEKKYIDNKLLKLLALNISNDSKVDIFMNSYKTKLSKNTIKEIINSNDFDINYKFLLLS